jgi:hypothetical protein
MKNDSLMLSPSSFSSFLQYVRANSCKNVMFLLDRQNLAKSHHYPLVPVSGGESGADAFHDWSKCDKGDVRALAGICLDAGNGGDRRLLGQGFWKLDSTSGERHQVLFEKFIGTDSHLNSFPFDDTLGSSG